MQLTPVHTELYFSDTLVDHVILFLISTKYIGPEPTSVRWTLSDSTPGWTGCRWAGGPARYDRPSDRVDASLPAPSVRVMRCLRHYVEL